MLADTSNIVRGVEETNGKLSSLNESAGKAVSGIKNLALGFLGFKGAEFLGDQFKDAATKIAEQQKLLAQTNAVLASTGGAAGVTADKIVELSDSIEKHSTMTKEDIQNGENLLLTFTNIKDGVGKGNDVFSQSTQLLADMSTAMGQDTKTSAIQLGKALNDPVKGITALQRVGVSFTDSQKKQIETLQKSGNVMGAQKVILGELSKEFGGSAAAAGDTFSGKMTHLKESVEDVFQNAMKAALPIINTLADFLTTKAIPAITKLGDWLSTHVGPAIKDVFGFIAQHQDLFKALAEAVGVFVAALTIWTAVTKTAEAVQLAFNAVMAINPFVLILAAIIALVVAIVYAWQHCQTFRDIVLGVWNAVKGAVEAVLNWFTKTLWPGILAVYNFIKDGITAVLHVYIAIWTAIIQFVMAVPGRIRSFFSAIGGWFASLWGGIKNGAVNAWNGLLSFIKGLPGAIIGVFGSAGSWLLNVGKNIVEGLWNGLKSMSSWLLNKIEGWAKDLIPGPIAKILGIASPSKLMHQYGIYVAQGLANGMNDNGSVSSVKAASTGLATAVANGFAAPQLSVGASGSASTGASVNITVNAGMGTDGAAVGRQVVSALQQYSRQNGNTWVGAL